MILFLFGFFLENTLANLYKLKQLDDFETTTPDFTPTPTNSPSSKGLSLTWIIVIIVSVIVIGSILITLLVFWIVKKARSYGHDLEENLMGDNLNNFHQNS